MGGMRIEWRNTQVGKTRFVPTNQRSLADEWLHVSSPAAASSGKKSLSLRRLQHVAVVLQYGF